VGAEWVVQRHRYAVCRQQKHMRSYMKQIGSNEIPTQEQKIKAVTSNVPKHMRTVEYHNRLVKADLINNLHMAVRPKMLNTHTRQDE